MIAFSGILSSATIVHGFNGYLSKFIEIPHFISSISIISILCIIAILGISQSVKVASLLTLIVV